MFQATNHLMRECKFLAKKILYEHCMTKPKLTECVAHIGRKYRRQWHKNSYFPFLSFALPSSMQIKKKNTNNSNPTHN